jgi:hypothetical protein
MIADDQKMLATFGARPVPDLEGYYATADGRIFSTKGRQVRELSQHSVKAYLCVKAAGKRRYVHALVNAAWNGPRPVGTETCHNNGQHCDNRASNLRWDTHAQNAADAVRHGTQHRFKPEERLHSRKLTPDQVVEIRGRIAAGEPYRQIAPDYDVDPAVLTYIKQGRTYRSVTGTAGGSQSEPIAA